MINERKLRIIRSHFGNDYAIANESKGEVVYHCPFCPSLGKRNNDRKLYVNTNTLRWYCQRCKSRGTLSYSKEYQVIGINDIFRGFDNNEEDEVSDFFHIPKYRVIDYPESLGYKYLISRGFSNEDMIKYSIRISGDDKFIGRVVVPNKIISSNWTDMYTARDFLGEEPRYKNPPASAKSKILFNYDNIPNNPEYLILNEGPLNSIIAGNLSVASYGKSLSNIQLKLIMDKHPQKVYISYDKDAWESALELGDKLLGLSVKVYIVDFPDDKDAVDLGKDEYYKLVMNSKPYNGSRSYRIFGVL